jgi:hypothetical protein
LDESVVVLLGRPGDLKCRLWRVYLFNRIPVNALMTMISMFFGFRKD